MDWGDGDRDESGGDTDNDSADEVIIKMIMMMIVRVMTFIYICSMQYNTFTDFSSFIIPQ